MTTPPDLLQRNPAEAAARIARGWLADTRAAAARLADPGDAEALHDFRVGLRRLRSTLRAFRRELAGSVSPRRRRRLGALQRATGAARDAEVALAWLADRGSPSPVEQAGSAHLVALLEARHAQAMNSLGEAVLPDFERVAARLDGRLRRLRVTLDLDHDHEAPAGAGFGLVLAAKLRRAARRLERRLSRIGELEDRSACHRARLAGKRLRILLEPLGEPAMPARALCKQLQDDLGELNDAHVLAAEIRSLETDAPAAAREGLGALAGRVEERASALYLAARRRWVDAGAADLQHAVAELAQHCEAAATPDLEIERKYLLRRLPELAALRASGLDVESLEIEQGWLPGQRLRERLRRTRRADGGEEYRRTVKLGRGVTRLELEEETTREVFETLWSLTEGCRVHKRRYRVQVGDRIWEIDEFLDRELALAEVELPDAEQRPEPPEWLDVAREVTDDAEYTNLALAR